MKERKKFENSLQLLAKSSVIVFVGVVLSKIFTYGYRVVIARNYGPEFYGLFTLGIMVLGILTIFSSLGIQGGLLRYVPLYRGAKKSRELKNVLRSSLVLLVFTSVILAILMYLFSGFLAEEVFRNEKLGLFLKAFSFALPFLSLGRAYLSILRGFEEIGWFSFISNVLENFSRLFIISILILFGFGYKSIITSHLGGIFVLFIASYVICRRKIFKQWKKEEIREETSGEKKEEKTGGFKGFLSYSWPLMFFGIVISLFHWTDSFIIGVFRSASDVGFYNAAIPLSVLLTFPKDVLMQLFFPLVTKEYGDKNKKLVRDLTQQTSKWILILTLPFFFLILVFPGIIINIFFGEEYLVAKNSLRILSISAFSTAIFEFSKNLISIVGRSKLILFDTLFFSLFNLILNLLLVPPYGINGAAAATTVSLLSLNIVFALQARKHMDINPIKINQSLKILIIGALSSIVLFIFKIYLDVGLTVFAILSTVYLSLYFFVIYRTKVLDKYDLEIIKKFKNKFRKHSSKLDN